MTERVKNVSLKKKKINNDKNSDGLDEAIERVLARERGKECFPLRINRQTVIYVTKDKCNEQYAEEYRRRINKIYADDTAKGFK